MITSVADTHTLIWYLAGDQRLSTTARTVIDSAIARDDEVAISAITLVELVYLTEKGRIGSGVLSEIEGVLRAPRGTFVLIPVNFSVATSLQQDETRSVPDMPDRIIAATALYLGVPLISRDRKITLSQISTVW